MARKLSPWRLLQSRVTGFLGHTDRQKAAPANGRRRMGPLRSIGAEPNPERVRTSIERIGSDVEWVRFGQGYSQVRAIFHDTELVDGKQLVWACVAYGDEVRLLRSDDYFETFEVATALRMDDPLRPRPNFLYRDKFSHTYVFGMPSPLIIRNSSNIWEQLDWEFSYEYSILQHLWNVTEDPKKNTLIFTEYSWLPPGSLANIVDPYYDIQWGDPAWAHGVFTSTDEMRTVWDTHRLAPNGECFRHIHGLHCHPDVDGVRLLFLGDYWHKSANVDSANIGLRSGIWLMAPGIDPDRPREISMDHIPKTADDESWNGPTHVTWWPDGSAFISGDPCNKEGWFCTLGPNWSDPESLQLKVQFRTSQTELGLRGGTPWVTVAVAGTYETYCSVFLENDAQHSLLRYTPAEGPKVLYNSWDTGDGGLHIWLSGGRNNRLPSFAKYIFAGGSDNKALRIKTLAR